MRIVTLSDTHLSTENLSLPDELVASLQTADAIIHAGDFACEELVHYLETFAPLYGVQGNCDGDGVRSLLPPKREEELEGVRVGIMHGWGGRRDLAQRVAPHFPAADLIVFGHSHETYQKLHGNALVFNPGSASAVFSGSGPTYGIITLDGGIDIEICTID